VRLRGPCIPNRNCARRGCPGKMPATRSQPMTSVVSHTSPIAPDHKALVHLPVDAVGKHWTAGTAPADYSGIPDTAHRTASGVLAACVHQNHQGLGQRNYKGWSRATAFRNVGTILPIGIEAIGNALKH